MQEATPVRPVAPGRPVAPVGPAKKRGCDHISSAALASIGHVRHRATMLREWGIGHTHICINKYIWRRETKARGHTCGASGTGEPGGSCKQKEL